MVAADGSVMPFRNRLLLEDLDRIEAGMQPMAPKRLMAVLACEAELSEVEQRWLRMAAGGA